MDIYGIADGVRCSAQSYFKEARGTGRTERLIRSLKPGDRVICHSWESHRNMHKMLARLKIADVMPVLVPVDQSHRVVTYWPSAAGVTYYTHEWLEAYWMHEIGKAQKELEQLSRFSSLEANSKHLSGVNK